MNNSLFMGVLNSNSGLPNQLARQANREVLLLQGVIFSESRKRLAVDVLHDQVRKTIHFICVLRRDDVGMLQFPNGLHLPLEASRSSAVQAMVMQDFYCLNLPQFQVASLEDLPHTSTADKLQQFMLANLLASRHLVTRRVELTSEFSDCVGILEPLDHRQATIFRFKRVGLNIQGGSQNF